MTLHLPKGTNEPLAMPRGSVRAILAVLIVGTVCGMYAFSREVPDGLLALAGSVSAFYFLKREVEGPAPERVDDPKDPFDDE